MAGAGPDQAWERALELAWDAFCGQTTPVGAVVVNAEGIMVAEGLAELRTALRGTL